MVMDEAWLATVTAWFQQHGREIPLTSRDQALVPEGATVFPNAWGTAPGLALEDARGIVVLLPGVPHELRGLVTEYVLPFLRSRATARLRRVRSRRIRTAGIGESALGEQMRDLVEDVRPLTVAFLPSAAGVDVRFTATGLSDDDADQRLARACALARERLGLAVYATDDDDLAAALGRDLAAKGLRLAVAESCTGGLIAKRLTDAAGASAFLVEGFVTYSNEAKQRTLGVPADMIERHGAVSEQVVRAMVDGALRITDADCAVAITGIAGPGGGSAEKPVGTVWIAAAYGDRVLAGVHRFRGDRTEIRDRSAQVALLTLRKLLAEG
jgi:nicotinamide-nucleotide amidase